jgi:UDP-GlcNAc3NAcA epimerase
VRQPLHRRRRSTGGARLKILSVVGARPQFIKAAAVSRTLRATHHEVLLHTGQHYDDAMSDRFFRDLGLPAPDVELNVGSGPHAEQTAHMLTGIERAILEHMPDRVMVYGDTNSTLAGALAAAKLHVPVAHVEAGLRSFNRRMPEEINRVIADQLSDLLFCPSQVAAGNLAREGITTGVHIVGDVMSEAVRAFAPTRERAVEMVAEEGLAAGEYFVATIHRAENTDEAGRLHQILAAFAAIGEPIVFPAHPRVSNAIARHDIAVPANVRLTPPAGYVQMLALVTAARAVLTDSGGLQKEAYWLGVPCVTLRDETEWVETVDAGWNHLAGADAERIVATVRALTVPATRPPLYGERGAVARVCSLLTDLTPVMQA